MAAHRVPSYLRSPPRGPLIGDDDDEPEPIEIKRMRRLRELESMKSLRELDLMMCSGMEITPEKLDEIKRKTYVPYTMIDYINNEYTVDRCCRPAYKPEKGDSLYDEFNLLQFPPKRTASQVFEKTKSAEKDTRRRKKKVNVVRSLFGSSSPASTCTSEGGNIMSYIGNEISSSPLATSGVISGNNSGDSSVITPGGSSVITPGGSSVITSGAAAAAPIGVIIGINSGGSSVITPAGSSVITPGGSSVITSGAAAATISVISGNYSGGSGVISSVGSSVISSVGSNVISSVGSNVISSVGSSCATPYTNNTSKFEDDPPIYLHALSSDPPKYMWHLIKPGDVTPQDTFLGNILPTQPKIRDQSATTVTVGSRIYLIGGFDPSLSPKSLDDFVYYIDTTSNGQGRKWKKGLSLPKPIAFPFAVGLNNNKNDDANIGNQVKENMSTGNQSENRGDLLLVGGYYGPSFDPKNNSVQAHILEEGGSIWRSLKTAMMPTKFTGQVTGHVVHRCGGTKHMLVYSIGSPDLYEYDFASDSWAHVCKDFGHYFKASAVVDSILYSMDSQNPGYIFARDTSSSQSLQKRFEVKLDYPEEQRWWVPQLNKGGYPPASFFMVPLGNHKLAIIWYYRPQPFRVKDKSQDALVIWCTRWKVSEADPKSGRFELKAYSRARYFSDATKLVNCLPILQAQRGETPDDVAESSVKGTDAMIQ